MENTNSYLKIYFDEFTTIADLNKFANEFKNFLNKSSIKSAILDIKVGVIDETIN